MIALKSKYRKEVAEPQPELFPKQEVKKPEPVKEFKTFPTTLKSHSIPKTLIHKWELFGFPPKAFNRIYVHKFIQNIWEQEPEVVEVKEPGELIQNMGKLIKPSPEIIEILDVEEIIREPEGIVIEAPVLRQQSFIEWQRENKYFQFLGLGSRRLETA